MVDEKKIKLAQQVYQILCEAIQKREWSFEKDEEKLLVHFCINGSDIPMEIIFVVDAARQLIRLTSPLPFKMSEAKRVDAAIATCAATYIIADGSFDYDIYDGTIVFRMTTSFSESLIGEELIQYMISCTCTIMDKYNDQFLGLDKGVLSTTDFISTD